jgi:hypothetical protein
LLFARSHASADGWCQRPAITVDLSHPGAKISPLLHGIFFEEIHHSGDGGLYALTILWLKTAKVGASVRPKASSFSILDSRHE